jgi:20S proteasome subunit alpha 5
MLEEWHTERGSKPADKRHSVTSQSHHFNYAEPLSVESCTQSICDLALRFGEGAEGEESIMSRPFGVALLIGGWDENGPQL